jgi:hypothetical protein
MPIRHTHLAPHPNNLPTDEGAKPARIGAALKAIFAGAGIASQARRQPLESGEDAHAHADPPMQSSNGWGVVIVSGSLLASEALGNGARD